MLGAYKLGRNLSLFISLLLAACTNYTRYQPTASPSSSVPLAITTIDLPRGTLAATYTARLAAAGGILPYTWSVAVGALPLGMTLNGSTGTIAGTPTQAGGQHFDIQVQDAAGQIAQRTYTLSVVTNFPGTTYYVDSMGGSDGNNGTSESAPWQSIAKVNSSKFSPGDGILFKRGDTWREELVFPSSGDADNSVWIDAYGTGAAPTISGADLLPATSWSVCVSCPAYIWQARVTVQPNIVMFNGVKGNKQTALSNVANPMDWFWGANILYVWCTGNPGSSYGNSGVESGRRPIGIDLSGISFVTIQNLEINGTNGIPTDGAIYAQVPATQKNPHDVVLNQLRVLNGAGDGIHLQDCNNCLIQNSTVSGMAYDGISLLSVNANFPITSGMIRGNTVYRNQHNGIVTSGCAVGSTSDACLGGYQPHGLFISGLTLSGNTLYNNGLGIYLQWTNDSTITENSAFDNSETTAGAEGLGIGVEASSNNVLSKNLLYGNRNSGIEMSDDSGTSTTHTGSSNNVAEYNAIHDNGAHGLFTNEQASQNNQFLYNIVWNHLNGECFKADGTGHQFYGNTCYKNFAGIDLYTSPTTPTTGNIKVKNNIFADSLKYAVKIESGVSVSTLIFDYNAYDQDIGQEFCRFDVESGLAGWRSTTGFDAHSIVGDPQFVSSPPTLPSDFAVQSTSPTINSGADLGSPFANGLDPTSTWPVDVKTASQGTLWNIGALMTHP